MVQPQVDLDHDVLEKYKKDGFAIIKLYNDNEVAVLEKFTSQWLYRLLAPWVKGREAEFPLDKYHVWSKTLQVDHGQLFRAQNRYMSPELIIEKTVLNSKVDEFMRLIGWPDYKVRDEGLGWIGFRFIRPGVNDGYPFSRKAWGYAKNCVSCWIPIIGHNPSETLRLIPGSHLKEYESFLPTDQKFTRGEYRLAQKPEDHEIYSPALKKGEAIFYDHMTLHSEDVIKSSVTRLSLEFRVVQTSPTPEVGEV